MFKKCTIFVAFVLLLGALTPVARGDTDVPTLVRVPAESPQIAAYLMSHFDETHNHGDGYIELLLWPGDRATLDALGIDYEVVIEDLAAHDAALASGPRPLVRQPGPDRTDYRRYVDYQNELQALAEDNPKIVRLITMPEPTLEGRTVYGVEIAHDVKGVDGRGIAYIDGVHHAREWPAGEFPMIFAHWLVEQYDKGNPNVVKALKQTRVIVVPIVNADGFDYSRESLVQNSSLALGNGFEGYWRKNRRSLTGVTIPVAQRNPDAFGVDPNRNYSYLWGDQNGGSSGLIVDQTYRGAEPFSEPETRNVRGLALSRPFTSVVTNHTYQGSVLRPGGPTAPDAALLEKIGGELAATMGDYDNRESVGYPTTGTTDDWTYAAFGTIGFTIEHGRVGFHPPYAQTVGGAHERIVDGFFYMVTVGADPRYHSIVAGKVADGPAKLTITKQFKTELSPGNPIGEEFVVERLKYKLTTNRDGSFEWHLPPSTRPFAEGSEAYKLTVTVGGKKRTLEIVVDRGEVLDLGRISL